MKKTFYLLRLQYGGNTVLEETKQDNEGQAISLFQQSHPELKLNNNGYTPPITNSGISYCVANKFGE